MGPMKRRTLKQRANEFYENLSIRCVSNAKRSVGGFLSGFYSRVTMLLFRRRSNVFLVLLVLVAIFFGKTMMISLPSSFPRGRRSAVFVERKQDLLNTDVSQLLMDRDWSVSPISEHMLTQKYVKEDLVGFVSNLDMNKLLAKKAKKSEKERQAIDAKLNLNDYKNLATCPDLAYRSFIHHSVGKVLLEDDLKAVRSKLKSEPSFLWHEVSNDDDEKGMTENEIIQKRWFQFGTSAVWLEREQCYVAFSRVIYSSVQIRDQPHVSLVRAQAFDKNWREIRGKRIPYLDMPVPSDMTEALRRIDRELGLSDCHQHADDSSAYDMCVVENAKNRLISQKRKEKILSKYYMTYPAVLEIPFAPDGDWRGPEDPHVVLRKTKDSEEPVVVFNIWDDNVGRRIMLTHMPHRKVDPLLQLSILGRDQRGVEKNWTPFFHRNLGESSISRGFIHFIYSFSPLEILKCSLNDGFCEMVFEAETLRITEENKFGGFRGGTQFVPLPDVLPQVRGQHIWVGFPKQHIDDCGCGDTYYRPMFSVLVEHDGVYSQELLVPAMGFNIDVVSWDLKGTYCTETNIMSPNSIAHWDVVKQDPHTKEFEDFMTITLSEADINTRVVTLKGMLNFILGMYREKELQEKFEISEQADVIIGQTLKCLKSSAYDYCRTYGKEHQPPAKLDETKKKEDEDKADEDEIKVPGDEDEIKVPGDEGEEEEIKAPEGEDNGGDENAKPGDGEDEF